MRNQQLYDILKVGSPLVDRWPWLLATDKAAQQNQAALRVNSAVCHATNVLWVFLYYLKLHLRTRPPEASHGGVHSPTSDSHFIPCTKPTLAKGSTAQ